MQTLVGHTSPDTAYEVSDYPYGFRLRTTIRYWVETKKGHGQRLVSQTMNPKTGRWNKPKASTYAPITVMFLDAEGHIYQEGLTGYSSDEEIDAIERRHAPALQENREREIIRYLRAAKRAEKRVTWTIHSHEGVCDDSCGPHQTIKEQGQIMRAVTEDEMKRETVAAMRSETYPEEAS